MPGNRGVWTPESLGATLEMWLRADTDVLDAGGAPASDGEAIKSWLDMSANAHDCDQAVAGNRPTLELAGGPDGHPCVRFADGKILDIANDFAALTAAEIFYVIKFDADPPAGGTATNTQAFLSGAGNDEHMPFTDEKVYMQFGTDTRRSTGYDTGGIMADWRLLNEISTTTELTLQIDGDQKFTDAGANVVAFSAVTTRIGGGDGAHFLVGRVAEIVLCNAKLSAPNKALLETYFLARYPSLDVVP